MGVAFAAGRRLLSEARIGLIVSSHFPSLAELARQLRAQHHQPGRVSPSGRLAQAKQASH